MSAIQEATDGSDPRASGEERVAGEPGAAGEERVAGEPGAAGEQRVAGEPGAAGEERAAGEPDPRPSSRGRAHLDAADGHLAAWAALAFHNAVQIAGMPLPDGGLRVRALHHLFDAGQMLAMGALVAGLVKAWERWGPRRPLFGYVACGLVSAVLSFWIVSSEVAGPARTLAGGGSADLWQTLLTLAVALVIPAAALVGSLLARPWIRFVGVGIGAAGALANFLLLRNDYFGAHFYLTWGAATIGGASLCGAELPWRPLSRKAGPALYAAAVLLGAAALLVRPRNAVAIELFRLESAIVAPVLARVRAAIDEASPGPEPDVIPAGARAWFVDRSGAPAIPPSEPRLLPDDAIVILITIDAARADVFAGEAHRKVLPSLLWLRDRGVRFTRARTPAPQTYVALPTMFSGKYYSQQLWGTRADKGRGKSWPHKDTSVHFPKLLADAGIPAATFASEYTLGNEYGVARGFTEEQHVGNSPPASEIMNQVIQRINDHRGGPLFLYTHFLDAHHPYNRALQEGPPFDRYVAELGLVDIEIARLWKTIVARGLQRRAVLLFSADHGEAFGEHNTYKHATTVYDELLRVPLFLVAPGVRPRVVEEPVSLVDLGPTVLDLLGQPTPGWFMGQSLTPYLRGESPALGRPVVADSGRLMQAMVFPDGIKMIRDKRRGTVESYDLARDPGEEHNLFREDDAASRARLAVLRAFFRAHTLTRDGYVPPYVR